MLSLSQPRAQFLSALTALKTALTGWEALEPLLSKALAASITQKMARLVVAATTLTLARAQQPQRTTNAQPPPLGREGRARAARSASRRARVPARRPPERAAHNKRQQEVFDSAAGVFQRRRGGVRPRSRPRSTRWRRGSARRQARSGLPRARRGLRDRMSVKALRGGYDRWS